MPGAVAGPLAALGIVRGTVSQGHREEGAVYATQHHHYHRLCRRHDGVPIAPRACRGEPAGHAARRVRTGRLVDTDVYGQIFYVLLIDESNW